MPEDAPPPDEAAYGWQSDLPTFYGTQPRVVRLRLENFIHDAGTKQIRAWDASIPCLQRECRGEGLHGNSRIRTAARIAPAGRHLPGERCRGPVFGYARDLRSYHAECADRRVHAVLVPTRGSRTPRTLDGVTVVGPEGVDRLRPRVPSRPRRSSAGMPTPPSPAWCARRPPRRATWCC